VLDTFQLHCRIQEPSVVSSPEVTEPVLTLVSTCSFFVVVRTSLNRGTHTPLWARVVKQYNVDHMGFAPLYVQSLPAHAFHSILDSSAHCSCILISPSSPSVNLVLNDQIPPPLPTHIPFALLRCQPLSLTHAYVLCSNSPNPLPSPSVSY
jgi:hypothetical protein